LWINTHYASADWGRDNIVIDVMRTARAWRAATSTEWNNPTFLAQMMTSADENDYPTELPAGVTYAGTYILMEQGTESAPALAGRYRFEYQGTGTVTVVGAATGQTSGPGWIEFDYTPTATNSVEMRISNTDPVDNLRGFRCWNLAHSALLNAGRLVNPAWASAYPNVRLIRFMQAQGLNEDTDTSWVQAAKPTTFGRGISVREMVGIGNELGADIWLCIPCAADQNYVTQMATVVRDNLNPALKCYVEYANEWWNWAGGFVTAPYLDALAAGRGFNWAQMAGGRSAETLQTWSAVFAGQMQRIVRVGGVHTGWLGLEADFLNAPGWVAEAPGRPVPHTLLDAIAVAGYFGGETAHWPEIITTATANYASGVALAVERLEDQVEWHLTIGYPHFRNVCNTLGKQMVMYEGGTHFYNPGTTNNALANQIVAEINRGPLMVPLLTRMIEIWEMFGDGGWCHYSSCDPYIATGDFGALQYINQTDSPRHGVLMEYNNGTLFEDDGTPVGGQSIDYYGHYNSLYNHILGAGAGNLNTNVGNWTRRMGLQAPNGGNGHTLAGSFLFHPADNPVPPYFGPQQMEGPSPHLQPWTASWTGAQNIEAVMFLPDNFDAQYFHPTATTNRGFAYVSHTLSLIDAWESNAPNANRRYIIYAGWPDLLIHGGTNNDPTTLTPQQWAAWMTFGLGAYQTWFELYVSLLQAARPNLDIRLHNVSKAVMLTYRDTVVSTIPITSLFEDLAPHGRNTWYFLAGIAEYIELYGEKPPVGFVFDGAWDVHSTVTNNYQAIVDYMWGVLRP
jgi:hypothetical protein